MPRTTLALKFGVYGPALTGPLFLLLSLGTDALEISRGGGLQAGLSVSPALFVPSVLVMSYLAFGPAAFGTGLAGAVLGPSIERWEVYQAVCTAIYAAFSAGAYLAFVWLIGVLSPHDRISVWVAAMAGALTATACARWTRKEHAEAVLDRYRRRR